ncbi:unnamed protein product [Pseudo-nitzschia multistriata]|uniref:Uncharacterized protein n=1 Tax=Pseudo-nitzschia multistriata TaxID=183589 RepID=A0A448Z9U5_9STRA|nr:unnamed protein product [Pseudo-nitzschia multistriata]
MFLPPEEEPVSVLKALSAKSETPVANSANNTSKGIEQAQNSTAETNTIAKGHQVIGPVSRRSLFKKNLYKDYSEKSFRSLNLARTSTSGTEVECENLRTRNIVNRALAVMTKSLEDRDCLPQSQGEVKVDTESDTSKEFESSDNSLSPSISENDNESNSDEEGSIRDPKSIGDGGTLTAQTSFRKIAKKRRKARGQSSFHHTKSSKEYLRKAQEAYQKLKISEQSADASTNTEKESNDVDYGYGDAVESQPKAAVNYGYGDPSKSESGEAVDFGYGDPTKSQVQEPVDYGYEDPEAGQPHLPRRGRRARRRNSVTKFSVQAASVVAAKAAAERILQLKPSLTSLTRGRSKTPTKLRRQLDHQVEPANAQQPQKECRVRRALPQRSSRNALDVFGDSYATKYSSKHQEVKEPKESQHKESPTLRRSIQITENPHLKLTSNYFSPDPKPRSLFCKNSGISKNLSLRFKAPLRTDSWLSHDTNTDDDDADSLASDMESLCTFRNNSFRLDASHSFNRNADLPPVPPPPPQASPLTQASPSLTPAPGNKSRLTSLDHLANFSTGRSGSAESKRRNSLVVTWSDGSGKGASKDNVHNTTRERLIGDGNKIPILPFAGTTTTSNNTSISKSCMPAPVIRTPSFKGSQ